MTRGWLRQLVSASAFAVLGLASSAASASLIGQTLTHGCPQCGPPYSQSFVVTEGLGPELTPFNQWSLDVEASTVTITWLLSGNVISPLDFTLSGILGGINSVTVDPLSTFVPTLLTFGPTSIGINLNSLRQVTPGLTLILNVAQQPGRVPEPTTLALIGLGLAGLALSRRRRTS